LLIYLSDESQELDLEDINNLIKSNGHKELTRTCGNNYAIWINFGKLEKKF